MNEFTFSTVHNGDIELRVAVAGSGPLILFIHGWPELWYSWRHQMRHFAGQGVSRWRRWMFVAMGAVPNRPRSGPTR